MVHKIIANANGIEIWLDSSSADKKVSIENDVKKKLLLVDKKNKTKLAEQMKIDLQASIDHRILRTDMPFDDPAIISDPSRPDFFWDGDNLVARAVIVESVVWDGQRYVPVLKGARE